MSSRILLGGWSGGGVFRGYMALLFLCFGQTRRSAPTGCGYWADTPVCPYGLRLLGRHTGLLLRVAVFGQTRRSAPTLCGFRADTPVRPYGFVVLFIMFFCATRYNPPRPTGYSPLFHQVGEFYATRYAIVIFLGRHWSAPTSTIKNLMR